MPPHHTGEIKPPIEEAIIHCTFFTYDVVLVGGRMPRFCWIVVVLVLASAALSSGDDGTEVNRGAREDTPSRSEYFSWINNTNEGATEAQTLVNLEFFRWLYEEFGMRLDIYAFDAGAIDGKRFYGKVGSERFQEQFPNGFEPMVRFAKTMGTRLGVWGGPDGFGDGPEEERARTEQMVRLCRDLDFALFKFDAVCGPLRPEKEDAFIHMMTECRRHSPDLILLNHRLGLDKAQDQATTFLWEGRETYVDVFSTNRVTAPHHRADALSRGLVPELKRLTEDHGVCLSSSLDHWDDDLVLQAFNRALILAPQIYGNPWLLRDDEYPKLARIFNLYRKYREILVDGIVLPEEQFGPAAVSRGDSATRLITLRNLGWTPVVYEVPLDSTIGLEPGAVVHARRFHPTERILGDFSFGDVVPIEVPPFRSLLLLASTQGCDEPGVAGKDFDVIGSVADKPATIRVYDSPVRPPAERLLATMQSIEVPEDAEAIYEATVFAADNNALEVRSLQRSGETAIPQVDAARKAFFSQETFLNRGIWDRNLFDGDSTTGFWPSRKYGIDQRVRGGCFRLDLGEIVEGGSIVLETPDEYSLQPLLIDEASWVEISTDLRSWRRVRYMAGTEMTIDLNGPARYLRFQTTADRFNEIKGWFDGRPLDRSKWRASNLFAHPSKMEAAAAWHARVRVDRTFPGAKIAIAIDGEHGVEGAYAAARVGERYIGAPDRASAYPSNTWEYVNARRESGYTYFIPITEDLVGIDIDVFVLGFESQHTDIEPVVWLAADPVPAQGRTLDLE